MSVQEVAFELGYQDPAYFARFFKKSEGSPLQILGLRGKRESTHDALVFIF
jgi:AraC family 4-hydroxyphenylacetate 3-monooxygenase operon regulatory protein